MTRCSATTKTGMRCSRNTKIGLIRCFQHLEIQKKTFKKSDERSKIKLQYVLNKKPLTTIEQVKEFKKAKLEMIKISSPVYAAEAYKSRENYYAPYRFTRPSRG